MKLVFIWSAPDTTDSGAVPNELKAYCDSNLFETIKQPIRRSYWDVNFDPIKSIKVAKNIALATYYDDSQEAYQVEVAGNPF